METEPNIIDTYVRSGQLRIVYRHLLQLGEGSLVAGEANECAGEQNQFWEMRDLLYREQFSSAGLSALAQQLRLDVPAFDQCIASKRFRPFIQADFADAQRDGIVGRPFFDINGTRLVGSQGIETFRKVIDAALQP